MGWISWLCPGMNLKRWLLLFTVGVLCCALGLALFFNYQFMGYVEELMFRMTYLTTGKYSNTVSMLGGFLFLCFQHGFDAGRLFVFVCWRLCYGLRYAPHYSFRCGSGAAGQ